MAELPPVTVATPAPVSVVTPVVKRRWWGRALDVAGIVVAFLAALLASVGEIDFASLGFTPTEAAWGAMALFVLRFALAYRPIKSVELKVEPKDPR